MPLGSMAKYFADRGGPASEHNGKLHWPGTADGFPFRGDQIPDLRGREHAEIPLVLDHHSDLFRLWEPEEKARYDQIQDRIANGWYIQRRLREIVVDGQLWPAMYLEWAQIYGENPNGKHPSLSEGHMVRRTDTRPNGRPGPPEPPPVVYREAD